MRTYLRTFTISRSVLLRMRNDSDKSCTENQNTILCTKTCFQKLSYIRDNVEKFGRAGQDTDGNIIQRMRCACWITKVTDTHSFVCGNKMPTRCNRGFCCRSYCLLNMFRAPLGPSSGAQEYYSVVAACGISCCGFQVAGLVWS